jgi:hypothetical protein
LRVDDEVQAQRTTLAMMQAFGGGRSQQRATHLDDDEEIIDTTKPEFAKAFKGFINEPGQRNVPTRQMSTEIKMG